MSVKKKNGYNNHFLSYKKSVSIKTHKRKMHEKFTILKKNILYNDTWKHLKIYLR